MQSIFHGVREYLTPVLSESSFLETGVLTPDEFVAAGDNLIYKCPTWKWEAGDADKTRSHLPKEKQYLVTRNVPCRTRVSSLEDQYNEEAPPADDDESSDWLCTNNTNTTTSATEEDALTEIGSSSATTTPSVNLMDAVSTDYFEEADLASFSDNLSLDESAVLRVAQADDDDNILKTRTYDISITYDKYYQTPRVFISGYNECREILSRDEMFQDIMQDYANRTVTMEAHPHLSSDASNFLSIHPCQHAAVMKRITANIATPRVDQYLFIFLKFIQSVIPTIDYDYTMQVDT